MQQTDAVAREYAVPLTDLGFQALMCSSVHGFKRLHHPRRLLATVMLGHSTEVVEMTARLRRTDPRMWIVWINGGGGAEARARVFAAGADLCLVGTTTPAELGISIQAIYKRNQRLARCDATRVRVSERQRLSAGASHVPPAASDQTAEGRPKEVMSLMGGSQGRVATWASALSADFDVARGWALVDTGRLLRSPLGKEIPLTAAERIFLGQLLTAEGVPIHRNNLAMQHPEAGKGAQRSADVLLSRLRRKCRRYGEEIPILAVRSWGYMMTPCGAVEPHRMA